VSFDSLFHHVGRVALLAQPGGDSIRLPADILLRKNELVLVDAGQAELKEFRRADGALLGRVGQAGDAPGEFRKPIAAAALDSGRWVVLDESREVLSVWDSTDHLVRETTVLGWWTGLAAISSEHRYILAGVLDIGGMARIHEFNYSGQLVSSYRKARRKMSPWEASFSAPFLALQGDLVVSGSFNTNQIFVHHRTSGTDRPINVAQGWFIPPEWPNDMNTTPSATKVQRATAWLHHQVLLSKLIPLSSPLFLARFDGYRPTGERLYYYALVDTLGRTIALSSATAAEILRVESDTAFWLARDSAGAFALAHGVLAPRFREVP